MGKNIFAMAALLIATATAHATDSQTLKKVVEGAGTCSNFIRADAQNVYFGFGPYKHSFEEPRKPIRGSIRIVPIAKPAAAFAMQTNDAAIDAVTDGNSLFILTYSGIEVWDLQTRTRKSIIPTYAYSGEMAYREHARGFARFGDTMIIAHGRLGVSFFDLKTGKVSGETRLLNWQLPHESEAMDVTIQGHYAYVVMQSFTLPENDSHAFSGVVVIDMNTHQVVSEAGGMDPGADSIASDGKKVIVSFLGNPLWKYSLASIHGKQMPEPETRVWQYPIPGYPTGKALIDADNYYTCYVKRAPNGSSQRLVPMALDRKTWQLN